MMNKSEHTEYPAIQDLYDTDFQVCYGCGARNPDGLQLKSFRNGERVTARFIPDPSHSAIPGVVYGGLIASLIDCHGIATGAAHFQPDPLGTPPRCVTGALNVNYLQPTPMNGQAIELSAHVVEASERKAVAEVEVMVDGEVTATGRVVAVKLRDRSGQDSGD